MTVACLLALLKPHLGRWLGCLTCASMWHATACFLDHALGTWKGCVLVGSLGLGFWRSPTHELITHIDHWEPSSYIENILTNAWQGGSETWRIAHVQCERRKCCMPDSPPRTESCWADPAPSGAYGLQVCSHHIAGISCMLYDTYAIHGHFARCYKH